jgi:uncharacterized protein
MHSLAWVIKVSAIEKNRRGSGMSLVERYGPWAVIAGASEGTGRAFAQQLAEAGLNCVLIARREAPLQALAEELRTAHGVEVVTASVDLSQADAFARIEAAVGGREVGLYVSNAGADVNGSFFLDKEIEAWIELVNRNVITALRACHYFGTKMRARGRGGILLVGSGACYGSGPNLAVYSGAKAFDLCFAEGLWSELQPHGVDVLFLAMSTTDTPALHALLAEKGVPAPPNLASPDDVARDGLARLPFGPVHNWGQADDESKYGTASAAQRRARVEMIAQSSKAVFGEKKSA